MSSSKFVFSYLSKVLNLVCCYSTCDNVVICSGFMGSCSWIMGSIFESICANHAYSENIEGFWKELFETYNKSDGYVAFNVHQKISSVTQSGSSFSDYFNKLDSLWKEFYGLKSLIEYTYEAFACLNDHAKLMKLMQLLCVWNTLLIKLKVIYD